MLHNPIKGQINLDLHTPINSGHKRVSRPCTRCQFASARPPADDQPPLDHIMQKPPTTNTKATNTHTHKKYKTNGSAARTRSEIDAAANYSDDVCDGMDIGLPDSGEVERIADILSSWVFGYTMNVNTTNANMFSSFF